MWKKYRRKLSLFTVLMFLMQVVLGSGVNVVKAAEGLTISLSVNSSTSKPGEDIIYTIKYSYASTIGDSEGTTITDVLPDGLEYVSTLGDKNVSTMVNGQEIRYTFQDDLGDGKIGLKSGSSGVIKLTARFKNGITIAGAKVTNTVIIKDNVDKTGKSSSVDVTAKLNTSNWKTTKTRIIPSAKLPALDQPVTYELAVVGNSGNGQLNLENVTLTDKLPEGAVLVTPADSDEASGIEVSEDKKTVTWAIGTVPVGQTVKRRITIKYPSGGFNVGETATNNAEASVEEYGSDTKVTKLASVSDKFANPEGSIGLFSKDSRQDNDEYSLGQEVQYYIRKISNTGNVPLDKFNIIDNIPEGIKLTKISTGKYNDDATIHVYYQTNINSDWRELKGSPFNNPDNAELNVSDLDLGENEYVTKVKWDFGTVQPGFSDTGDIKVFGEFKDTVKVNDVINNTATVYWTYSNSESYASDSVDIKVADKRPWIDASKSVSPNYALPEQEVTYTLTIKNHPFATGDYTAPEAYDLLPEEMEFAEYTNGVIWNKGNTNITEVPTFTSYDKTIDSKTRTVLKWSWPETVKLHPGQYITVSFKAKIKKGTSAAPIKNTSYYSTGEKINGKTVGFKASKSAPDTIDIDNNGDTAALAVAETTVFVKFLGRLNTEKWVKGELDEAWSKYPHIAQTLPGGIVDYKFVISNDNANGPIKNIVIIDILPNKNDKGVIDTSSRGSEWRPNLVNRITGWDNDAGSEALLPSGIKVYYSEDANISKAELDDPVNGAADSKWKEGSTLTADYDYTKVKAIKLDCRGYNGGNGLPVNEKIYLHWPMRAPVGAPVNAAAWNSFGVGATYPDMGATPEEVIQSPFLPTEPIKVGFKVVQDPTSTHNLGDYVWEDLNKNGMQDSGELGLDGVLINLYKSGEATAIAYTRSGPDQNGRAGYYNFPDLPAGNYKLEFIPPTDYKETLLDKGSDDSKDSDISDGGSGKWIIDDIALSSSNADCDAGFYKTGTISGNIWNDRDMDNTKDNGQGYSAENYIKDVEVTLLNEDGSRAKDRYGSEIPLLKTDANGKYSFQNLDPGKYKIQVANPSGHYKFNKIYSQVPGLQGNYGIMGTALELKSGQSIQNVNVSMYLAEISGYIWHDLNADGSKLDSNSKLDNIIVKLIDKDGKELKNKKTAGGGEYNFYDLIPGDYTIKVEKAGDNPAYSYAKFSPTEIGKDSMVSRDKGEKDIPLTAGQRENNTVDAGLYNLVTIGDIVWEDYNGDGVNNDDKAVAGAKVELLDRDGNKVITDDAGGEVNTITTSADGKYSFNNLKPGSYYVKFTVPQDSNMHFTTQYSRANSGTASNDSDAIQRGSNEGRTDLITLISGEANTTIDAGLYKYATLGNLVWHDINGNGVQDGGEAGISGIAAELYKDGTVNSGSATTDSDGTYTFHTVVPGNYKLKFILSEGYNAFTLTGKGTADTDSDADSDGWTGNIALTSGQTDNTWDVGVYKYAKAGDVVWHDKNRNGIQDAGEEGIAGITINLKNSADNSKAASATTDAYGKFSFDTIIPGKSYYMELVQPADYGISPKGEGTNDTKDSDIDVTTKKTDTITLNSEDINLNYDIGLYKLSSIGDYVWEDKNGDGKQDSGEIPIQGVEVKLYNSSTKTLAGADTTKADGSYKFINLYPKDYYLEFTFPDSYAISTEIKTSLINMETADGVSKTKTAVTKDISLGLEENNASVDLGLYRPVKVSGMAFEDKNANGIREAVDSGIAGVEVELYNASNPSSKITSVKTDSDGSYTFTNLEPDNYFVKFLKSSDKHFSPKETKGSNSTNNSDADAGTGISSATALIESDGSYSNLDAGLYSFASIGDYVWNDADGDGVQAEGEKGLGGIELKLKQGDETKGTTSTGGNGKYSFQDLVPGTYTVEIDNTSLPQSMKQTYEQDGTLNRSTTVTLISGEQNNLIDFGFYKLSRLMVKVWEDTNGSGLQDDKEPLIENAALKLYKEDHTEYKTAVKNAEGEYVFENIEIGTYYIKADKLSGYEFTRLNVGKNDLIDNDADAEGKTPIINITSNMEDSSCDVGLYRPVEIGDKVWEDKDGDGTQVVGEIGVNGVTVTLLDEQGHQVGQPTVTKNDEQGNPGFYKFTNLLPGKYSVKFTFSGNYVFTSQNSGDDGEKDSDASIETGSTKVFDIASGEKNFTIDAGLYIPIKLRGHVWKDISKEGIQDENEPKVSDITVRLYKEGFQGIYKTTSTDAEGNYSFENLSPGKYFVEFDKPSSFMFTPQNKGNDNAKDSDVGEAGKTKAITLLSGVNVDNVDAGIFKLCIIDLKVINKTTQNPVSGAEVKLYDKEGNLISTKTTDGEGNCSFKDVPSNKDYYIVVSRTGYEERRADIRLAEENLSLVVELERKADYIPVIPDYERTIKQNTPYSGIVKGTEAAEGFTLTYSKASDPSNGTVVVNSDGTYTYTPNHNFIGVDTFKIMVSDGDGGAAYSTVTINVVRNIVDLIGTVTDQQTGKRIPNTSITFMDTKGKIIGRTTSDSQGNYEFKDVVIGNYVLIAENKEYSTQTIGVKVFPAKPQDVVVRQDIKLVNFIIDLTANPNSMVGDGKSTSVLTAELKDKNNLPLVGVEVVFSAESGSFPKGRTAITDSEGKASVLYKSDLIEGINSQAIPVKAEVFDNARGLHAEDQIIVTFEPGSIRGIVYDNDTKEPVKGAIVEVYKDFDGDGINDFYGRYVTGEDGKYKIAIPKGNTAYDVLITKPVKIGNRTELKTFHQKSAAGVITGAYGESFDSDKAAAGLILFKQPNGSVDLLQDYSQYSIEVFERNNLNKPVSGITAGIGNEANNKGIYGVEGLEKGKDYTFAVTYTFPSGKKIIVGKVDVTIGQDGEINISTTLIDPYGTITSAVTGSPIEGAVVELYYADTARNREAGIKPDTLVFLPAVKGFEPADNANPQYSDKKGKYGFMVFPYTDYYIVVKKPGYVTYRSEVISVEKEILKKDIAIRPEKLVQTGSIIDNNLLGAIGLIFVAIGTAILIRRKRRKI